MFDVIARSDADETIAEGDEIERRPYGTLMRSQPARS
jgi:hypothetical protein